MKERKKKKRGNGKGPACLVGNWDEEKCLRKAHSQQGNQLEQKGIFRESQGEQWFTVCGRQDTLRTEHISEQSPSAPQVELCVYRWEEGWVLESGVWRVDPGRWQLLAVNRQPEKTGATAPQLGKFVGKVQNTIEARHHSWSGMQGPGPPLNPPSPPSDLYLCRHWEGLPPEQACYKVLLVFDPPQAIHTHPSCGCLSE